MKYTGKRCCGRMLPFGAAAAVALLFFGCGAGPAAPAATGGPVCQLTSGTELGCYVQGIDPAGSGEMLAFWVDYGGHSVACLCAQPNCDHTGESCTARGGLPLVLPDGRLVWKDTREEPDGQVSTALWLSEADGNGRRLLVERRPGYVWPRFADSTGLYFIAGDNSTAPEQLYRVPLEGGKPETALELHNPGDGSEWEGILGVEGRSLVTEYVDLSGIAAIPQPDPISGDPQEKEAYRDAVEQVTVQRQVWLTDLDTGERTQLFAWECRGGARGWYGFWQDGTLYQVREDGGAVRTVRLDGTAAQREIRWPESLAGQEVLAGIDATRLVGGRMLLACVLEDGRIRAAVDPETGEAAEIRLQTVLEDGYRHPMEIAGCSGGWLLMQAEERTEQKLYLEEDGSLQQGVGLDFRYALLAEDDFLASEPDWVPLEGASGYLTGIWYW